MSSPVACEVCKKHGHRRIGRICPEGWLYAEVTDTDPEAYPSDEDRTFVVMVCSQECAAAMFKPGPGKLDLAGYKEPDPLTRQENYINEFKRTDFYKEHRLSKLQVAYVREEGSNMYTVTVYEPAQQLKMTFRVEAYVQNYLTCLGDALKAIFPRASVFNLPLEEYHRLIEAHNAVFGNLEGHKRNPEDLPPFPDGFLDSLCSDDE